LTYTSYSSCLYQILKQILNWFWYVFSRLFLVFAAFSTSSFVLEGLFLGVLFWCFSDNSAVRLEKFLMQQFLFCFRSVLLRFWCYVRVLAANIVSGSGTIVFSVCGWCEYFSNSGFISPFSGQMFRLRVGYYSVGSRIAAFAILSVHEYNKTITDHSWIIYTQPNWIGSIYELSITFRFFCSILWYSFKNPMYG